MTRRWRSTIAVAATLAAALTLAAAAGAATVGTT